MKAGWEERTIGEILSLEYGKPLDDFHRNGSAGYPVYGANGPIAFSDVAYVNKAGIVIGRKGSAGEINLADGPFWPLDVAYFAKFDETRFALRFLYYLMTYLDLPRLAKGVKPGINRTEVYSITSLIPPLPEQQRLVLILDEAFEGIATATANAERNLQNARAVFQRLLDVVYSDEVGYSFVHSLDDVCQITSALVDPRLPEHQKLLHVGGANIESRTGRLLGLMTAEDEQLISGKYLFDESMVLYSKIRPYLMKVARPNFRGLCSADIYPLSAKADKIDRHYLYHLLLSPRFTEYANMGSARAGMPKVNREHLFAYQFNLPSLERQISVANILNQIQAQTVRLESIYRRKIAALDELKKSLLHQAFSGEL